MATGARNLGKNFDIGTGFVPVDMQTGTNTGKRIALKRNRKVTFILYKAAGTGGDDPVLTFQEHTASSGGTTQTFAGGITKYYKKSEATLDNDESWVEVTQAAAGTVTLTGEAALQGIYVFEIDAEQLADTFTHMSLNIADTGSNAALGCVLYVVEPVAKRKPANLGNLLTGDATANV